MAKKSRKNLIHEIIKHQFETPIDKSNVHAFQNTMPSIIRPLKKKKKPPLITTDESSPNPLECRNDSDCTAGEVCIDGICQFANVPLPDDDTTEIPNDPVEPVEPIWNLAEIFSNIRACTQWVRDRNYHQANIEYTSPNKATYIGSSQTHRPILTQARAERLCHRLREITVQGIHPNRPNIFSPLTQKLLSSVPEKI